MPFVNIKGWVMGLTGTPSEPSKYTVRAVTHTQPQLNLLSVLKVDLVKNAATFRSNISGTK
jgi:hypothetical protein